MRLFAAVLPPERVAAELAAALAAPRRLPGADLLRWTQRPAWHFTLAFYGEVADDLLPELELRLARAARRHPAHELRLAGGGRFHDQVLWVGVDGDLEALRRLAGSALAQAERAGVEVGRRRPYRPHLTVARSRDGLDVRPFAAALADFRSTPWTVDRLSLVRSHPPVSGVPGEQPRYETVAAWPLGR